MSLTFGLGPEDQLNMLKVEIEDLRNDPLDIRKGKNAAITCWSLCDWCWSKVQAPISFSEVKHFQNFAKEACPALCLIQDVANAQKHEIITRYVPKLENSENRGGFSRAFSNAFKQAGLYLIDVDQNEHLLDELLDNALVFWEDVFSSNEALLRGT